MWKWLQRLTEAPAEKAGPPPEDSTGSLDALWQQALPPEEAEHYQLGRLALRDHPAGRALLALDGRSQAGLVVQAVRQQVDLTLGARRSPHIRNLMEALPKVAGQLLRRDPDFREEQLVALAQTAGRLGEARVRELPLTGILRACEKQVREHGLGAPLRGALTSLARVLSPASPYKEVTQTLEGLQRLLRNELPPEPELLRRGDAWADTLLDALGAMPSGEAAAWQGLLSHCATATPARPSSKWLARAKQAMSGLDPAPVLISCLDRIGEPGSRKVQSATGQPHEPDRTLLDDGQTDLLRGLVWCAGLVDDPAAVPALAAAVGRAADACFRKVQNHGPRNAKVGNACVDTLSRLGAPSAVAQLSRLRSRVQHPSARKQIEAALGRAAGRLGLAKAELEERMVPGQGLTEAEIRKLLPGQRDRLERLYLFPRDWDLPIWRERYLEHPLVGILARRLIWSFGDRPGFWREGRIVDAEGQPLEDLEGARVSLWHPLDAPADEVLAWRRRLEAWEVVQPFKQAHREIYLLTDAERQTATYSNRFAAHILKQHQLAALCRQRGWTCALQGRFDFHDNPVLKLPEHGLQVEFWVDPAAEEEISAAGIFVYVSTDQVRFCEIGGLPRPLEEIPPLLFSELMRDVDLFVSVASIGNDPSWGQDRQDADAWRRSSFGELGESARTRRELLGRLVPRLKIADRCTLTERFLVVRGDLRTYKIHLGSGNILMAPNDQYLCIVQGRTNRDSQPVLPFEGDGMLALILSKAFLLAEDTKIADPQIRSQIGR